MSKIQQNQQTHIRTGARTQQNKENKHPEPQKIDAAQLWDAPETMRAEDVLGAQQQVGNQVVQRALDKEDRRKGLTDQQGNLRSEITDQIQKKRGGGASLPENIQKEASKKLGRNFKDVRIHTDETADKLSRTINARAFTIGKDIFFKNGVFSPGSSAGRETIIHELTHVVQQGGKSGTSSALKLGRPDTAQEKEADRIGKKHASSLSASPAGAVQRVGEEDELQAQLAEEEEMLQAQSAEEEELQMQGEEDELQMQGDEEELQMQSDEDELQMQPDTGNVIQRSKWKMGDSGKWEKEDDPLPKKKGKIPKAPKLPKAPVPQLQVGGGIKVNAPYKSIKQARKGMGISSLGTPQKKDEHTQKIADLDKTRSDKAQALISGADSSKIRENLPEVKKAKAVSDAKKKWMSTLKDPKASKEDIEKAKERLGAFHKDVGKKDFKAAKAERRTALEESAKSGDDEAYEKWKSERKKTKGEKAKDFFKSAGKKMGSGLLSAGKWAGGKALKFAGSKLNEGVNHFLGIKEDDDDEKKTTVNVNLNQGSDKKPSASKAEGGGKSAAEKTIAELFQENKKLKAQLAKLEEAKAKV